MKAKLTVAVALTAALLAAGCGGDGSSSDDAQDRQEITALVSEINRVTREKDAQGFCAVMQPSGVTETFNTQAKCVQETAQILKQGASGQPQLEIEDISIRGDEAIVDLTGGAGGAPVNLVKEDGKWYIPLGSAEPQAGSE